MLITGATGLLGKFFARQAFEKGHELVVLGRDPARAAEQLGVPFKGFVWNASSAIPDEALEQVDAVVHLAGDPIAEGKWTSEKKKRILDSRVLGTKALARALSAMPERSRPKAWICASAIGIYGNRADEMLAETSGPARQESDFLANVCKKWESATMVDGAAVPNVRTVHLRFGIILSDSGGALDTMALPFRLGTGGKIGSGAQWMSWIHIADAAQAIWFAIENRMLAGPLNVVSPEPVTNAQFTRAVASALGVPALFRVPKKALQALLGEKADMVLASQRVIPQRLMEAGFSFQFGKLDAALTDLLATEHIQAVQWVPRPLDEVFSFFSDVKNLERITPPWLRFSVRAGGPGKIQQGTKIAYDLRVHGVPIGWESLIDRFEPNRLFQDIQLKGPYRLWEHSHQFFAVAGGTLVKDHVRYQAPLGALGRAVGRRLLKRDLARIFEFRRDEIRRFFG